MGAVGADDAEPDDTTGVICADAAPPHGTGTDQEIASSAIQILFCIDRPFL